MLVERVIPSFQIMPFVSLRVVCLYSSQSLYEFVDEMEKAKSAALIPTEVMVLAIEGSDLATKRYKVEEALKSIGTLEAWHPGLRSIVVAITDGDHAFSERVSALPMAREYALFFGYKPEE